VDLNRDETTPALMAGMKAADESTRFLSVAGQ
jgi:hypothetical protein